jgi:hypothetical protein
MYTLRYDGLVGYDYIKRIRCQCFSLVMFVFRNKMSFFPKKKRNEISCPVACVALTPGSAIGF